MGYFEGLPYAPDGDSAAQANTLDEPDPGLVDPLPEIDTED